MFGVGLTLALSAGCQLGSASSGGAYQLATSSTTSDTDDAFTDDGDVDASGEDTGGMSGEVTGGDTATDTGTNPGTDTGVENDCPRVRVEVSAGNNLNVRPEPSTVGEPIGSLPNGAIVDVLGDEIGEVISGEPVWYLVGSGMLEGYVSAAFASCTLDTPPDISEDGWYLPLECGMSAVVSQGNFGTTSHSGNSAYAFDFALGLGTPLVAMASGTVTHTFDETGPGDPCYAGGGPECFSAANYVTLLHADGTKSTYRHLQEVLVGIGEVVAVGEVVGLSGSTGYSTGRHAHVMRMEDCGEGHCPSIPVSFDDVAGDGVPDTDEMVTSGNCR